jgi:hypothetical protein
LAICHTVQIARKSKSVENVSNGPSSKGSKGPSSKASSGYDSSKVSLISNGIKSTNGLHDSNGLNGFNGPNSSNGANGYHNGHGMSMGIGELFFLSGKILREVNIPDFSVFSTVFWVI